MRLLIQLIFYATTVYIVNYFYKEREKHIRSQAQLEIERIKELYFYNDELKEKDSDSN